MELQELYHFAQKSRTFNDNGSIEARDISVYWTDPKGERSQWLSIKSLVVDDLDDPDTLVEIETFYNEVFECKLSELK